MSSKCLAAALLSAVLVGCVGGGGSSDGGDLVSAQGNGSQVFDPQRSATLSWSAPATRENGDGLAMGELQGYLINYGQDANNLSRRVEITNADVMDYTVGGLSQGDWYFTIQVVDVNGLVSAPSQVVSKTI
ncbi:MAG: fibronectin type III domain-containing protein [Marinobacter sp.]|uniref:fibronectin type III domain-containing protein n=1 Tax=Marinobacter sp. TaxID=50741 RepID=UPI00299DA8A5|nr:fibronectin type III domain-containing protein [Marinobacter sp.]MDX1754727.1 fibronectin type III domain-containing protein [Marinobacter sp.]